MALRNRTPSRASRSRFGVLVHPFTMLSASARIWSAMMKRMFGFSKPRIETVRYDRSATALRSSSLSSVARSAISARNDATATKTSSRRAVTVVSI